MRLTYAFVYVFGGVFRALEPPSVSQYLQLWQLAVLLLYISFLPLLLLLTPFYLWRTHTNKHRCNILIRLSSLLLSFPTVSALISSFRYRSHLCYFFLSPEGDFCGTSAMSWFMVI